MDKNSYDVKVEEELLIKLGEHIKDLTSSSKILLIADQNVYDLYKDTLSQSLGSYFEDIHVFTIPISEDNKTIETVTKFYDFALEHKIERSTPVIAFGGGVTGDLVGFFASSYLRGIPFIQMPTTLLAMVDSSVGGKVAYNHPKGKNMIGAFYQPKAVYIDPLVLSSLPEREFRCGIAECIKHGLLADSNLFDWMEDNRTAITNQDPSILSAFISKNVAIKASVVMEDEKEQGRRALLNLGHTFGHAIEVTRGYGVVKHGEAVALGCIAAAYTSAQLGHISQTDLERIINLFKDFNLPTKASLVASEDLYRAMTHDKKVIDNKIRLILLKSLGDAFITDDVPKDLILDAFEFVSE